MKATIKREDLNGLASKAAAVADGKAVPVLGAALLRVDGARLHVSATDLYTSVRCSASCTVDEAGKDVAVPAKALKDVVAKLPDGEVKLVLDGPKLRLSSGRSRYHLPTLFADDAPPIPEAPAEGVEVEGADLARLFDATAVSMSNEETRAAICCVHVDVGPRRLRAVSTDGHRITVYDAPRNGPELAPTSVPPKGVQILRALEQGPAVLSTKGGVLFVRQGDVTYGVKLLDEAFIPYDKVVPKDAPRIVRVDRGELLDATKRMLSVADTAYGVRLSTADGLVRLEAESLDSGAGGVEEVRADASEGEAIGLSARYLVDALGKCPDDEVTLGLARPLDPVTVRGEHFTAVIMPMRT